MSTSETCAEEHKIRANHYEKQVRYMRETMESQAKSYETFERQVHELTVSYEKISDECRQYKVRNKGLWEIVASLEDKCEEYLVELELLKSSGTFGKDVFVTSRDSIVSNDDTFAPSDEITETSDDGNGWSADRSVSVDCVDQWESDIVSLKMFAEETSRKHDIERCQRINAEHKLERANTENIELRHHVSFLQHRMKSQSNELSPYMETDSPLPRSKSMNSLTVNVDEKDSLNNNKNVEFEVNQCNNINGEENSSIRELFQRYNHNRGENEARRTSDVFNPICAVCRSKSPRSPRRDSVVHGIRRENSGVVVSSPRQENKPSENIVTNYREMFAQIFEKLKISHPDESN